MKTAVVSDGQGVTAYRLSDGSKAWSNTFSAPPADAKITDPQQQKVTTLGSSVLVVWSGKSSGSGLEPGKDISVAALYDLDTGKQVGTTHTFEKQWDSPRIESSEVHASTMTYMMPWGDTVYPDGTVRHVDMPVNADPLVGGQPSGLVTVTKDRSLLSGTSGSQDAMTIVLTNGSARVGSPLVCDMDRPMGRIQGPAAEQTDFLYSPNQQWAVWGKALVNLKTGENRCLSGLSSANVNPVTVTDAGDIWGTAGDKSFVLKHGAAKPTVMPAVPGAVTSGGIISAASDHISMFATK